MYIPNVIVYLKSEYPAWKQNFLNSRSLKADVLEEEQEDDRHNGQAQGAPRT